MKKAMVILIVLSMLQFMSSCTKEGASIGVALLAGGSNNSSDNATPFDPSCSGITSHDTLYSSAGGAAYLPYEDAPILNLKNEEGQMLSLEHDGENGATSILNLEQFCRNAQYAYQETFTYTRKTYYSFKGNLPGGEYVSVSCALRKVKQEMEAEEFAYYELLEVTLNTPDAYNTYLDIPKVSVFTWYDTTKLNGIEEIHKEEKGTFVEEIELNGQIFNNVHFVVNSQDYGIYIHPEKGIIAVQTLNNGLFVVE